MLSGGDSETSVQVAVRIRPQNTREQIDMCRVCTFCTPDAPQIVLGKDKAFTYDYVFDTDTKQEYLYETCVEGLVNGCFDGYNATVLAYGQTGSGKTYTMGTGFDVTILSEQMGVIPRAVEQIFTVIRERRSSALENNEPLPQFEVKAQFLELYNEEIIDLFEEQNKGKLRIHEDTYGNIYVAGATEIQVSSEEETLACLKRGALSRTVGSTNMNAQSSRSHAIFTLHLVHQRQSKKQVNEDSSLANEDSDGSISLGPADWETLKAKFHFVDLAGSERLKRTGATGERAKEGISINCGLLSLGNVISALGDKAKKGCHVPYRDSKLTRLLQDSLGGNSKTLMIACISPTDRDFMETLNTLKYSNRARNIKNKVLVNQDKMSQQLSALRSRIQELELELQEFKSGRMVVSDDGSVVMNDMASEITMLRAENDKLRLRIKAMQQVIESQSNRIASMTAQKDMAGLGHPDESTGQVLGDSTDPDHSDHQLSDVIQGYLSQIEELKSRLILSESLAHQNPRSPFRRAPSTIFHDQHSQDAPTGGNTDDLLKAAKENIAKLKLKGSKRLLPDPMAMLKNKSDIAVQLMEGDSSEEDTNEDLSDDTEDTVAELGNSTDDSDTEADETDSLASSVAELSSEINLKQQLVDQLEKAQRNFYSMKSQYEDKMQLLQQQIKSIESERDRVLKEMSSHRISEKQEEKTKEIKAKYERQLSDLKAELKSLKTARKEHAKAMKKNAQHEKELKVLKEELLEMKKQRVKLVNKMRSEANQKKLEDARKAKEIRQLQKESRKRDHKIKSLEIDARRRENVLKRRQEELSALRREKRTNHGQPSTSHHQNKPIIANQNINSMLTDTALLTTTLSDNSKGYSATVKLRHPSGHSNSGYVRHSRRRASSIFSSDSARKKWKDMEKKVFDAIMKRQTMANLAKDMDMWIEKRDKLSKKTDELKRQKELLLNSELKTSEESELAATIEEDLDSISANIDYIQENIVELQNDLIAVDDTKSDGDTLEAHSIITSSSPREAKYLLEHLLDLVLNLGLKAAQKEAETKVLEARLRASEQSAEVMKTFSTPQVSQAIVNAHTIKKSGVDLHDPPVLELDAELEVASFSSTQSSPRLTHNSSDQDVDRDSKSRRRALLPAEMSVNSSQESSHINDQGRQPSDPPVSSKDTVDGDDCSEESGRTITVRGGSMESKRKKRAISSTSLDLTASNTPNSCPSSPTVSQRQMKSSGSEVSVWSRLATTSNTTSDTSKGTIQPEKIDPRKMSGKIFHCTHTACGHAAAVLSVCATQNYLFSASQDRTVKIWNLKTCSELLTLDKHFSYVRCVRFCPGNNLIFTASQSHIKLWDMRHHRARCIKTFGPPAGSGPATGSESAVQDLVVSRSGDKLFSASGNFINIWDLRKLVYQGRLVGHNGAVSTLAIGGDLMATGARDRLIKLYDLEALKEQTPPISQPSICTLYPPHYDAISSLALYNEMLFSSCGVTIKQWDIKERSLKQAVDGAHSQGNNIHSLAIFNSPMMPMLVSGCKGGFLKMWNPESCSNIGEFAAHKHAINTVTTNSTCIFTGSSDKTIRIWRPSPQE